MKKFLIAFILLFISVGIAHAGPQCVTGYKFQGFSRDWDKAYRELEVVGDCH